MKGGISMSTTVKAGWLKDSQGNKFAPKTLSSQVVTNDGQTLEDKLNLDITELSGSVASKAEKEHTHAIEEVTGLSVELETKVPTTRTVNGKVLSEDITLSASDVGADPAGSAESALSEMKTYADNLLSGSAGAEHDHNTLYYTKEEIDNFEFVTAEDIDTICGASIQIASEVMF